MHAQEFCSTRGASISLPSSLWSQAEMSSVALAKIQRDRCAISVVKKKIHFITVYLRFSEVSSCLPEEEMHAQAFCSTRGAGISLPSSVWSQCGIWCRHQIQAV